MKVIILAGGGGTRLFPLSRACFPKQFLQIDQGKSLLVQTVERFKLLVKAADLVIVTNQAYFHHVKTELAACGAAEAHILLEPVGRNTAPAIALAARYCLDELGAGRDEVLFVTPSDHIIKPVESFVRSVRQAAALAVRDKVVTFGIQPDKPETGYGYIQAGKAIEIGYEVESFKEKPDQATAEEYLAAGNYYWNSGMFAFTVGCVMEELQSYQPEIYQLAMAPLADVLAHFSEMPTISIDYAVAEKSRRTAIIPFAAYWNDIGSWDAIYEVLGKDEAGNALQGDCLPIDCTNSLMLGRSRLIAGIGLEDVLVVETDDVILVAKKGESQKVKDLVGELKARGRREASEQTTMYRPWGSYTVLGEGPGYKMKKIVVNPGEQLSLQLHYHRSEHWIVIGGTAKVTVGDRVQMVHENESIFVPQTTKHRLENPGKIPLAIIEVQNGSYLGEDDIVRFEDIYGRA
ncbi:MAG: mannose-1-phosphate guanylyltransferase/mannose-6-phosphate isomerase [Veillonellales bacterium]